MNRALLRQGLAGGRGGRAPATTDCDPECHGTSRAPSNFRDLAIWRRPRKEGCYPLRDRLGKTRIFQLGNSSDFLRRRTKPK